MDEIELVRRAKNGDSLAFGRIYRIYLSRIFNYFLYSVSSRFEAEDLTQDVFFKAFRALANYKEQLVFRAWIFKIARNTLIDHYRKKRETYSLEKVDFLLSVGANDLERRMEQERIVLAMQKLPGNFREVLILRFFQGFDLKEVAQIMGKRGGTVRVWQFRALQKLKKLLT